MIFQIPPCPSDPEPGLREDDKEKTSLIVSKGNSSPACIPSVRGSFPTNRSTEAVRNLMDLSPSNWASPSR